MNNQQKSVFLSAIAGNILEYYDFTVYLVFYSVIGKTFFPGESETAKMLSSLVVFAVGFITRPIGGIVFGYLGDKLGRRIALIISMFGMALPTFTIGLIPSYEDIGLTAPIILVIMRLFQGLCISGEGAGAAIFILEHHRNLKPGFVGGLVHASNIAGTILAHIIALLINRYLPDLEYAWRFAFILGGFMGLVGFYLRLRISETPIFKELVKKKQVIKAPFIYVVKNAWRAMFITFALGAFASSIVYFVKTYVIIFCKDILLFDEARSLIFSSYAAVIMMITMPISGYISDNIGKFKMITMSSIAIFIFTLPALLIMNCDSTLQQILAITILASLAGMISGTAYIFIISLFNPRERFSGVAFSYNFGVALCGGTSAYFSKLLTEYTGWYFAPALYIMCTATIFLYIIYLMQSNIRNYITLNAPK